MKSILDIIILLGLATLGLFIFKGCQFFSKPANTMPNFGENVPFTFTAEGGVLSEALRQKANSYKAREYMISVVTQQNTQRRGGGTNYFVRIMPKNEGLFPASEEAKMEAEIVVTGYIRRFCVFGNLSLLDIIEVDPLSDPQKNTFTKYVVILNCHITNHPHAP